MAEPRVILIAGPTASGKSGLALELAERLGGVVINADSMQVYRDLRVLTARPSAEDEARAPHALYGFVPAQEAYSAGRFAADAARAIAAARAGGHVPIVVGGTGLYFKALLQPLAPIPAIPDEIRAHWRAEALRLGPLRLHEVLEARDPATAARLMPSDPQRIVRALEVLEATGKPLIEWQKLSGEPVLGERETVRLVMTPERDWLLQRVDARLEAMMKDGALDEVRALDALKLPVSWPILGALGVQPLTAHLHGEIELEAAIERTRLDTRQYIKRQRTWLKRNMISWNAIDAKEMKINTDLAITFIKR